MNETETPRDLTVKILVIIGFIATIVLIVWLATAGIKYLSPSFASLANVADSIRDYKPASELVVTAEKAVVNSGESFKISWNDMKQTGDFKFAYTCKDGINMLLRDTAGTLMPVDCTKVVSLPPTVQEVFLSIDSNASRFADVEVSLAFVSTQKDLTEVDDVKITVVNAAIPAEQEVAGDTTEKEDDSNPSEEEGQTDANVTQPPQQPTYTTVYPQSNPAGYVDLSTKVLGTGEVVNGSFAFRGSLDSDDRNAIKFDIQNIGTKTSNSWNFLITLPGGIKYRSDAQIPLKPQEHSEFVLEFNLDDDDDFASITIKSETISDSNSRNNTALWSTPVDN